LFRANLDFTISQILSKNEGKILKEIYLVIHSTMTPCKTCSLDIALEFARGRIFNFFQRLDESTGKSLKKTIIVSFEKPYEPSEGEKKYGFSFVQDDSTGAPAGDPMGGADSLGAGASSAVTASAGIADVSTLLRESFYHLIDHSSASGK